MSLKKSKQTIGVIINEKLSWKYHKIIITIRGKISTTTVTLSGQLVSTYLNNNYLAILMTFSFKTVPYTVTTLDSLLTIIYIIQSY